MSDMMVFDNHDSRLKYHHLVMALEPDVALKEYSLPEGYSFVDYTSGDRDIWIEIEKSAKEFSSYDEGLRAWSHCYASYEAQLPGRMYFIAAPNGEKVATATAFFDPDHPGDGIGWLHWVAVRREYQGKGLARPLIAKALSTLRALYSDTVYVSTQTNTWLAAKLYLDFGFRPTRENAVESEFGYRMLKTLTAHPALAEFEPADIEDMLNKA